MQNSYSVGLFVIWISKVSPSQHRCEKLITKKNKQTTRREQRQMTSGQQQQQQEKPTTPAVWKRLTAGAVAGLAGMYQETQSLFHTRKWQLLF